MEGIRPVTTARRSGLNNRQMAARVGLAAGAATNSSEDGMWSPAAGGSNRRQGGDSSDGIAGDAGTSPAQNTNNSTSSRSSSSGSSIRSSWFAGKPAGTGAGQTQAAGAPASWFLRGSAAGEGSSLAPHPRQAATRMAVQRAPGASMVEGQSGDAEQDEEVTPVTGNHRALHFDLEGNGGHLPADLPGSPSAAAFARQ
jgi:hypothetical protein